MGKTLSLITKRGLGAEGGGTPVKTCRSKSMGIRGPVNDEPQSGKVESQRETGAKQWRGWPARKLDFILRVMERKLKILSDKRV